MDRSIIYSQQIVRLFDIAHSWRDQEFSLSRFMEDVLGVNSPFVYGLAATQSLVPSLTINISAGRVYQIAPMDATDFGGLEADETEILKQGHTEARQITLNTAGMTSGQSRWVLIEARFLEEDEVRDGDPTNGVLAYFNAADPTEPLQGPGDTGAIQDTVRKGAVLIHPIYGAIATTGSEVAPNVSAGFAGLYLINLTFGQTTVTNGQILIAGPSVAAGVPPDYPSAPFAGGMFSQHHKGGPGQAPKIQLGNGEEVQGVLPFGNLPASNTNPESGSKLVVEKQGTGTPVGTRAGQVGDEWFQTDTAQLWKCTTAGAIGVAVWKAATDPNIPIPTGTALPNGNRAGTLGDRYFQTDSQTLWICTTTGNSSTAVWKATAMWIPRGTGNPNGTRAGSAGEGFFATDTATLWICTTTGNSSTAVWASVGASPKVTVTVMPSNTYTIPAGKQFGTWLCRPTANADFNLNEIDAGLQDSQITIKNDLPTASGFKVTVRPSTVPATDDTIEREATHELLPGDSVTIVPGPHTDTPAKDWKVI